jgi:hypothetical protein
MGQNGEFDDLVIWVVLGKGRENRLAKMVGDRALPVLKDTERVDFGKLYGASKRKAHLVFGRDGCLVPGKLPDSNRIARDPKQLLPVLRRG